MVNFIAQKIGIYYRDREWMLNIRDEILDMLPEQAISKNVLGMNQTYIELYDGTSIEFIKASQIARGYKCNKIIVQPYIDVGIYINCIRPNLINIYDEPMVCMDDYKLDSYDWYLKKLNCGGDNR